jgi:hypothetical protein
MRVDLCHISVLGAHLIHDIVPLTSFLQFAVHRSELLFELLDIMIELVDLVLPLLILDSQCRKLVPECIPILHNLLN